MSEPTRRKPVGGISAARITPRGASSSRQVPLLEERSSYIEELSMEQGLPLIRHTLTLVLARQDADALMRELPEMSTTGITAQITERSGRRVQAGISTLFGTEQPLYLRTLRLDAGIKPTESPSATLIFIGQDTTPAAEISN